MPTRADHSVSPPLPPRPRPARCVLGARRHPRLVLSVLLAVYSIGSLLVFARMDLLARSSELAFSTPDAQGYRALADYLMGDGPQPRQPLLEIRPYLYPLVLSLYRLLGVGGIIAIQWGLNLGTAALTLDSVRRLTGSPLPGLLVVLLLLLHPTFGFIALHALAEPLAWALVALAINLLVRSAARERSRELGFACLCLAAAGCAKPSYLPALAIWGLYAAIRLARLRIPRGRRLAVGLVALSPLIVQLGFSQAVLGKLSISSAGRHNFEDRFFPAVESMARTGTVEHYRSEGAELARRSFPDLGGKLRFVAGHPVATVKTFGVLLGANLLASSGFTHSPELIAAAPRLSRAFTLWSRVLNAVMVPVHLAGLWLLVRALRNRAQQGKGLLLALAALNYSVLALAALSYWQGDRLILTALPAWLVLYPALGWAAHAARRSQPPLAGGARAA